MTRTIGTLAAIAALLLGTPGCPDDTTPGQGSTTDTGADAGTDSTGADSSADTTTGPDATPDVAPDIPPPPTPVSDFGETVDGGLLVWPVALEGNFVYGLGTPPSSRLARRGTSAAGLFSMPAIVEVADGLMTIRALDRTTLMPVEGPDGAIEIYSIATEEDGRYRIDLTQPIKSVEILFGGSGCKYVMTDYAPNGDAVFTDSLLTWPALETYERVDCNFGGSGNSVETHVHFLRRADANPSYETRAVTPGTPFGFFVAPTATDEWMTRMPHIAAGNDDGTITYYLSSNVPAEYEPAVRESFEAWNDAFEDAIGQRPFVVENAPPEMVPWDPRFRVVLWDEDSNGSGGAVAPFIEDPFTGEMFETYVVLWLADLDPLITSYQVFTQKYPEVDLGPRIPASERQQMFADAYHEAQQGPANRADMPKNALQPRVYPMRPLGMDEIGEYMDAALAADLTDAEIADIVVRDFLVHEIGHNLGLRHNFIASADKDHKAVTASATSTMDYVVGMTAPGTYDVEAMRHGYGDGALDNTFMYCTDEDTFENPACLRWDYGSPPVWATDQVHDGATQIADSAAWDAVAEEAQMHAWSQHFHTARLFMNTEWEDWDSAAPMEVFQWMFDWVECADDACVGHAWFRAQWAKRLISNTYAFQAGWGQNAVTYEFDYPPLENTQVAQVYNLMFGLLLDPAMSLEFKTEVIEHIPASDYPATETLLDALTAELGALADPTADETTVLSLATTAKATWQNGGN